MEKMPYASWVVLKIKWNNELSDTLYMKGLRICRILICSQSHDLSLSHYLSFRFIFCGLFCLISSGFSHLSHRKSWSDSENCDLWSCAMPFTSDGLSYNFVTFKTWKHKAVLSTWIWRFFRAPVSFGGNECSEFWTLISLGAPRAACTKWCLWTWRC